MSRLLGIVNPNVDPDKNPLDYWIWQVVGIPAAAEWDFERLQVYTTPAPDGNVCVWVCGPPTPEYRDGVFVKILVNAAHNPRPHVTDGSAPPPRSWEAADAVRTALVPTTTDMTMSGRG